MPIRMSAGTLSHKRADPRLLRAALAVAAGSVATAALLQTVLSSADSSLLLLSRESWADVVTWLGAPPVALPDGRLEVRVSYLSVLLPVFAVSVTLWVTGAVLIHWNRRTSITECLAAWGSVGWLWWMLPGVWELTRLILSVTGVDGPAALLASTPDLWLATAFGGWFASFVGAVAGPGATGADARPDRARSVPLSVILGVVAFAAVFGAMNWQLYQGLLIPHGDSAMYEEHLWNITHGKGFRSYLDQGLFLGEHLQFIHLLLIPLHLLWPSHLLLEVCESIALASGAIPVYLLARRHSGSHGAATLLALAWLCYFPVHFLDISIDIKTFRPTCLGLPALAFALERLDRGCLRSSLLLMLVALSAKEDYAIIIASIGGYLFLFPGDSVGACESTPPENSKNSDTNGIRQVDQRQQRRLRRRLGAGLAVFGVVYLLAAVTIVIPAFREGHQVHFVRYFGELGSTPSELLLSTVTTPGMFLGRLFSQRSLLYTLLLLVPLGFTPCAAPKRLLVAVPLFVMLCLLELDRGPENQEQILVPFHHFHAPLVPVLFWAAASGICRLQRFIVGRSSAPALRSALMPSAFALGCSLATCGVHSMCPLAVDFWDPGSHAYWRKLYQPGPRAQHFARIRKEIPDSARVASTDFVHPRFTHCARSYDYSAYLRRQSNYEDRVPADTDYIVIDTRHRYSTIRQAQDVRELQESPDEWEELLPDRTDGYFIVLRRQYHASESTN